MKVRVVNRGLGQWQWEIVAANNTVIGRGDTVGPKKRVVQQAERIALPALSVDVVE